ncbi:MAG: type IX secretion system membrane protein PorP/SprF [Edaphocola sp.]
MKTVNMLLGFMLLGFCGYGQQKPHYTQYILNQYVINPALSGIENYIDVNVSHRHQWAGIDGSPVTTYITAQGPINKGDYRASPTGYDMVDEQNPRGSDYWNNYEASPAHHGVGLQLFKDNSGALSNTAAYATYAYHMALAPSINLSAGFGAGVSRYNINQSMLDFMNTEVDPSVYNTYALNKTKFDLNAGVYLYASKYFVGLSAQQIVPSKLVFSNNKITTLDGKTVPHIFLAGGYRFLVNEDFNITPSLMLKYIQPMPIQAEANVKVQYRDALWAGLGYRHKDGVAVMAGFRVLNLVRVSYSFDYSTTLLKAYNDGTHELLLGFTIGNRNNHKQIYTCPRERNW